MSVWVLFPEAIEEQAHLYCDILHHRAGCFQAAIQKCKNLLKTASSEKKVKKTIFYVRAFSPRSAFDLSKACFLRQ